MHVGFSMMMLAPEKFRLAGEIEIVPWRILYIIIFGLALFIAGIFSAPTIRRDVGLFLLFPCYSVLVWVLAHFSHAPPTTLTFLPFVLFLGARELESHIDALVRVALVAVGIAAVYSVIQLSAYTNIIAAYRLPVLPLAFSGIDASGIWLGRPSGFYFEPLGASTVFAVTALFTRSRIIADPRFEFRIAYYLSLLGLLLSQSYGAIILYILFDAWMFRGALWMVGAVSVFMLSYLLFRDQIVNSADIANKLRELSDKTDTMMEVVNYLRLNPLVLVGGQVSADPAAIVSSTENTALELTLNFGVAFVVLLIISIVVFAYRNGVRISKSVNLSQKERRSLYAANGSLLYPVVAMFTQNAVWIPPVVLLFVLFAIYASSALSSFHDVGHAPP